MNVHEREPIPTFPQENDMNEPTDTQPKSREALAATHGTVWDEQEFANEFHVAAIIGTSMVVRRRSDGQVGKVTYQNEPRYYFGFEPHASADEA
jgi:hypothetical protein